MLKVPVCCRQIDSTMELDISSKSSMEGESVTKSSPKMSDVKCYDGSTDRPVYNYRQNHVSHVMLGGVHIVSLHIDGKERLCLAQISNTLLKQFSYNEIHNRRVALGITCVQCTPVQLEILRRAGAMPISSRRCGMITKREAERLVKSFLEDNKPPKLPENFYFEVEHQCGWGCRGKFEPARYNSSRAKCIKCSFCNLYFSPNKFIFHFHRTPESKYNHPDAANFNSWRRHLHLVTGTDSEDTTHAWEDVKAMFNGGSRKRMVSSPQFQESRHQTPEPPEVKKQKLQVEDNILTKPNFRNPYHSYPIFTMPGNTYPFSPLGAPNPLAISYHLGKSDIREERKPQNLPVPWRPTSDFIIPTYDFLWTNQFGARASGLQGFRPNYFSHTTSPVKDLSMSEIDRKTPSDNMNSSEDEENLSPLNVPLDTLKHGNQRLSAFKPVLKYGEKSKCNSSGSALDFVCQEKSQEGDNDDVDVGIDEDFVGDVGDEQTPASESTQPNTSCYDDINSDTVKHNEGEVNGEDKDETRVNDTRDVTHEENNKLSTDMCKLNDEADINSNKEPCVNLENINLMTKEDLQRLLQREMDLRRQVEDDINKIKEKLNDQVSRHPHQASEIPPPCVTGKAVVSTSPCITSATGSSSGTDAMCSEFEQERKIRLSMQQKLKEAQNVLHNFSCKTLPTRPFEECPFTHPSTNIQR